MATRAAKILLQRAASAPTTPGTFVRDRVVVVAIASTRTTGRSSGLR